MIRWKRKIAAKQSSFQKAVTLQSSIALWLQQLLSLEVSIGRDPSSVQQAVVQSIVKSTQKIPYSSVGFGSGTYRDEKNCFNSQRLVNISKSEGSTGSKKER